MKDFAEMYRSIPYIEQLLTFRASVLPLIIFRC